MGSLITRGSEQKVLAEANDTAQYLTFLAGDERFAIGILDV
ncbi:MAG: chemotaxis protein CheW, partial [Gammaproteobacteria bacterium]|nr:chemotaxis protein CheW [Gammaproteobacteria bacterium]